WSFISIGIRHSSFGVASSRKSSSAVSLIRSRRRSMSSAVEVWEMPESRLADGSTGAMPSTSPGRLSDVFLSRALGRWSSCSLSEQTACSLFLAGRLSYTPRPWRVHGGLTGTHDRSDAGGCEDADRDRERSERVHPGHHGDRDRRYRFAHRQ